MTSAYSIPTMHDELVTHPAEGRRGVRGISVLTLYARLQSLEVFRLPVYLREET